MGDSLDIAKCAFIKPDKTNCANIVNKSLCEFCTYHVKKAYKDVSKGQLIRIFVNLKFAT